MHEQSRIMCAVDLSWRSEGALNYAIALAQWRHAPLDFLFVVSDRKNARDMAADLVVLGVQKRGVLGRLFGSTTSRTFRRLSSPVLAVPVQANARRADVDVRAIAA